DDRDSTVRPHRAPEHANDLRRGGVQPGDAGRGRPHHGDGAGVRRQSHRHGGELRRLGTAPRPLDGAPSRPVFPGDEDGGARLRGRAGADSPLARPAANRPARPDPAAQPRQGRRVGDRTGAGRRAGGGGRGPRGGDRALHRRDRPWPRHRRHPPPQPGTLPLRHRAAALQLRADAKSAVRRRLRGFDGGVPG
ncbi:MAG: Oxidoreductase, aldo/keto reductase family, partial [uncultured Thermomicrobiales bacterium]